ncbi:hypothetical protein niasHT_028147 [Heterodera trifolii]|uniref:DNA replication factor Dna2 N-terminal domain-containing protein n=1 Tax=Heterodera trifolii TaxID=157864 RepID=A0ABD2JNU0_9BILA
MCQNTAPLLTQVFSDSSFPQNGHLSLAASPHTLVSGTAFAQSLYCARKALFSDRFRSPGSNLAMTVGKVAHELFQIALVERPVNLSREWLFRLWRCRFLSELCIELVGMQCSLERFEEELSPYLDNITSWIRTHITDPCPNPIAHLKSRPTPFTERKGSDEEAEENDNDVQKVSDSEPVYFNAIRDIEENVWTPTLGLKGRIDVSFLASSSPSNCGDTLSNSHQRRSQPMVMPLELKTGKSYGKGVNSIEHQSQVLIYSMMLAERANDGRIGPGFLLYLRDNAMVEVRPRVFELRNLLQMRNRLAVQHFSRFSLRSFPAPLTDPRSCRLCPFNALCGTLSSNLRITADSSQIYEPSAEEGIICLDSSSSTESSGKMCKTVRGTTKRRHTWDSELKKGEEGDNKENIPPSDHYNFTTLNEHGNGEEEEEALSPEMRSFLSESTAHLSDAEVTYARRCIRRILAQWEEAERRGSIKKLFSKSPTKRERLGTCFANMELISKTTPDKGNNNNNSTNNLPTDQHGNAKTGILLRFKKASNINGVFSYAPGGGTATKFSAALEPGSVVTVSTDSAYALLIATIVSVDVFECSVTLRSGKDFPAEFGQQQSVLYHLDKNDGFSSFAYRLGSVAALLEDDERAQRLRSILTLGHALVPKSAHSHAESSSSSATRTTTENAREIPTQQKQQIDDELVMDEDEQKVADRSEMSFLECDSLSEHVKRVLNTPDYAIAMGRDKKEISAFLLVLCRTLLRLNKSVLFCTNSNAAVDEMLQLLDSDPSVLGAHLLRIGRRQAVRPGLQHLLLEAKMAKFASKLDTDVGAKAFYCQVKQLAQQKPLLVACPLASVPSNDFLSSSNPFDFFLIDESFELADTELIRPLLIADRFTLCTAHKTPASHSLLNRLIPLITTKPKTDNVSPQRLITLGTFPTRQPMRQILCTDFAIELPSQSAKKIAAETPTGTRRNQPSQQQTVKKRRTMTLLDFWKK